MISYLLVLILVSFVHPPAETLTIILDEPSFSNQTVSFGEESIEVNKSFGDRDENPIDFSHLPVSSHNFFSFIRSFYGQSFSLNESNAYHFYYLTHYFQDEKLTDFIESNLNTQLVTWAWLKPFVQEADERNDLRALQFVGPFLSKIDDVLIDDVMAMTADGFKQLCKYCVTPQTQSWFITSMLESILNHSFDLTEFLNILNSCSIEALSFQQWDELLYVPLKDVEELKSDLMKFLLTNVKNVCVDTVVKENSDLRTGISGLEASISKLDGHLTSNEHSTDPTLCALCVALPSVLCSNCDANFCDKCSGRFHHLKSVKSHTSVPNKLV
ncbi:hypothetical protein GEMRC1_004574 [Eukaryota sp. GEM-RC1]